MAPIATICNNNKMKKIATEPVNEIEEPTISTASTSPSSSPPPPPPLPAVEAPLSEYFIIVDKK